MNALGQPHRAQGFRDRLRHWAFDDGSGIETWLHECQRLHAVRCSDSAAHRIQMELDASRRSREAAS